MKAIVKGNIIKCPICHTNEFYIEKDVKIRAIGMHDNQICNILKDELQCENCGWTGYFGNYIDPEKDYKANRITYEN